MNRRTVAAAAPAPKRRRTRQERRVSAVVVRWAAARTPLARLEVAYDHLRAAASGPQPDQPTTDALVEGYASAMLSAGNELLHARAARPLRGVS